MLVNSVIDINSPYQKYYKNYQIIKTASHYIIGNMRGYKCGGSITAVNFFLKDHTSHLSESTQKLYTRHILKFIEFLEMVAISKGAEVPFQFDLFDFDEEGLKLYRDYLRKADSEKTGRKLNTKSWTMMIYLVCEMYQYWSDVGWYHKNLGQSIDGSRSQAPQGQFNNNDQLNYTRKRRDTKAKPMGSIYARPTNQDKADSNEKSEEVRCFTLSEINAVHTYLENKNDLRNNYGSSAVVRDLLIFDLVLLTGLRVSEIQTILPVGKINAIKDGRTEPVAFDIFGKGGKQRTIYLPVCLLNPIKHYIERDRCEAVKAGLKAKKISAEPGELFVNHHPQHLGQACKEATLADRVRLACIGAGLCTTKAHWKNKNPDGSPFLVTKPNHSIHDLRHTFAVQKYFEKLEQFSRSNRNDHASATVQAMREVQRLLGHSQLETTQNTYAPYVHNHRSLEEFSEDIDQQRSDRIEIDGENLNA